MSSSQSSNEGRISTVPITRTRVVVLLLLGAAGVSGFAAALPGGSGLALLAIAGAPALFAVPPRGRTALGLAIAGVAVLVGVAGGLGGDVLAWVSVAALVLAGALTAWRGRTWPAFGTRFSGGQASESPDPGSLWRDLDRGHDPTEPTEPTAPAAPAEPSDVDEQLDPPRVEPP